LKKPIDVFSKEFWMDRWNNIDKQDSTEVHRGFSSPEFWDRASISYDRGTQELASRKTDRAMEMFERSGLCLDGMEILDIGCGTGTLAMDLARRGARVTAVDFSKGMLDRFRESMPIDLDDRIEILCMDWGNADIRALGWHRRFDLTIAFMSPAISTPEALERMMDTSKNACAMRGWAARRTHPILDELWAEIMGTPLDDKPQTLMIKFNLLVAMGFLPELSWDTISWENAVTIDEEFDTRLAFFQRVSDRPEKELKQIIRSHLESIAENNTIKKGQTGITGTLVWKLFENVK
jgi:SAM-dependent methyltransferase